MTLDPAPGGDREGPPSPPLASPDEIGGDGCRWPMDTPRADSPWFRLHLLRKEPVAFCGAPTAKGSPYCAVHGPLVHRKPTATETAELEGLARRTPRSGA